MKTPDFIRYVLGEVGRALGDWIVATGGGGGYYGRTAPATVWLCFSW